MATIRRFAGRGAAAVPPRPILMNVARFFSYTRLLERQQIRERRAWEAERARLEAKAAHELSEAQRRHDEDRVEWANERRQLINVALLKNGVNAPFTNRPQPTASDNGHQKRGAVGTFQILAREAREQEEIEKAKDTVARVPELPVLSEATKDRVRTAAEEKGLLSREPQPVETPAEVTT